MLGAYIRFERGFRYARQRVRTATVRPCACGTVAAALADAGWGRPGWRVSSGHRNLHGRATRPCASRRSPASPGRALPSPGRAESVPGSPSEAWGCQNSSREAALLQARLDLFQGELARLAGDGKS